MSNFIFFEEHLKTIEMMDEKYRSDFCYALMRYIAYKEEPQFNEHWLAVVFQGLRFSIDKSRENREMKSEAGKRGGRPKKEEKQIEEDSESINETCFSDEKSRNETCFSDGKSEEEREIEKEGEEEREVEKGVQREKHKRFSPPSLSEVQEYCSERQNHVDPNRFIDFYSAKGWRVGNQPMKDWKAAVRTWENRDNGYSKNDRPPNKKTGGIYAASMSGYGYVTADGEIVSG